jgi:hypothetical protein
MVVAGVDAEKMPEDPRPIDAEGIDSVRLIWWNWGAEKIREEWIGRKLGLDRYGGSNIRSKCRLSRLNMVGIIKFFFFKLTFNKKKIKENIFYLLRLNIVGIKNSIWRLNFSDTAKSYTHH